MQIVTRFALSCINKQLQAADCDKMCLTIHQCISSFTDYNELWTYTVCIFSQTGTDGNAVNCRLSKL